MALSPKYPIYILSKGRWESRLTARALERMQVEFRMIVERQEFDAYAKAVGAHRLLVLDPAFQQAYDPCCELEPGQSKGSGPARNFAWEHAKAAGFRRHWIVDDNIKSFQRLNRHQKIRVSDGTIFRCMEDFCDRYLNVAIAGPNYRFFVKQNVKTPPLLFNTKIYSCILIDNSLPFRWRARYNEDVDLCIRALKKGYVTVQFNAFLQDKMHTQKMKGGNTDELYAKGTRRKSEMLARLHPDVTRVTWRFSRMHHHVDYRPFAGNAPIRDPRVAISDTRNEYGMRIVRV